MTSTQGGRRVIKTTPRLASFSLSTLSSFFPVARSSARRLERGKLAKNFSGRDISISIQGLFKRQWKQLLSGRDARVTVAARRSDDGVKRGRERDPGRAGCIYQIDRICSSRLPVVRRSVVHRFRRRTPGCFASCCATNRLVPFPRCFLSFTRTLRLFERAKSTAHRRRLMGRHRRDASFATPRW